MEQAPVIPNGRWPMLADANAAPASAIGHSSANFQTLEASLSICPLG
jgi:hypothetical protein